MKKTRYRVPEEVMIEAFKRHPKASSPELLEMYGWPYQPKSLQRIRWELGYGPHGPKTRTGDVGKLGPIASLSHEEFWDSVEETLALLVARRLNGSVRGRVHGLSMFKARDGS
jgi:hypothetical protein